MSLQILHPTVRLKRQFGRGRNVVDNPLPDHILGMDIRMSLSLCRLLSLSP